ncbi:MAG: hypothetical protein ACRD2B_18515 [Terriglobia bacterium]
MPGYGVFLAILLITAVPQVGFCRSAGGAGEATAESPIHWKTPARLRQRLRSDRGVLEIDNHGITFRALKGPSIGWTFTDIQSFYLTRDTLRVRTYENRGWHLPGEKVYRFALSRAVPPEVAEALAARVAKPSQNGDPNPYLPAFAVIPARHSARLAGTNGTLRFTWGGIDYMTSIGRDARSWRWADIQTLAHPSAYRFTVGGYRETYSFELKKPMSQRLFDRLWDAVYGQGLRLSAARK